MSNIIGAISGYALVLSFVLTTIYVYSTTKFKAQIEKGNTISDFGISKRIRPYILEGCISIALLNIPFMYGLNSKFGLVNMPFVLLFGGLASIFLVFTGLSVAKPVSGKHRFFARGFMAFLLFDGISLGLFMLRYDPLMGKVILAVNSITILVAPLMLFRYRESGITEISFLGLNSLWILIVATLLLI